MDYFELFDNQATMRVVDKITITKNYLINFPSAFYKINNLKDSTCVLLYLSKDKHRIGIEFKKQFDKRGFKIMNSGKTSRGGGYIAAKNFFAMNGLIGKIKTGRYDYTIEQSSNSTIDRHDMYVVLLNGNN